jgi:aminoglycoside phosphotransferase (APT) family kinase protein
MSEASSAPRPKTSTRDREQLRARLVAWLATKLPSGAAPEVSALETPGATGMSSETLLFELRWREGGAVREASLVGRLAPDAAAVPVFPEYDLPKQARVIQLVAKHSKVPVPNVRWVEPDAAPLGSPFFVMDRVAGRVPPDLMPYTFGQSWLSELAPAELARFERASLGVLAGLHAIPRASETFAFLATDPLKSALRAHVDAQKSFYHWVIGRGRGPLIERCFDWLEAHWPHEGETVLSWGDARIGNILYAGLEPVAVLDWEMAALGPRELDLGWMIFLHRFFDDLAQGMGMPGMPQLLARERAAATYAELSGHAPRDLDWYTLYAALRHGIIMTRIALRAIRFGEREKSDDVDSYIPHAASLEKMLAGTYWGTA